LFGIAIITFHEGKSKKKVWLFLSFRLFLNNLLLHSLAMHRISAIGSLAVLFCSRKTAKWESGARCAEGGGKFRREAT